MGLKVRRRARAQWRGTVPAGAGEISVASGALTAPYSLRSRTVDAAVAGTNPEELIGAGLAGCFAMSVANLLEESGVTDVVVDAGAVVELSETDTGFSVTSIALTVSGSGAGLEREAFATLAEEAKRTCPISRALAGTQITLTVKE